jgi:hypothetical protein
MKILRCLGIVILLAAILLNDLPEAFAESSTIAATIFIRVLEKPTVNLAQTPDLQECLDSQLQRNPQSLPEIKVEGLQQNIQSAGTQTVRYTIYEKI